MAKNLKSVNPKTPKLYLLPKIHKEGNPGRPVMSSVECHTERISAFVDHHLQPMNRQLPSFVQDTTDFVKKIEALPDDPRKETILVTMDVRSLYTNIPNAEGIEAVKGFFRERARPGDTALSKVIHTFLTLILTVNNFIFNFDPFSTVSRSTGAVWAPNAHPPTRAYSWGGSRTYISTQGSSSTYLCT